MYFFKSVFCSTSSCARVCLVVEYLKVTHNATIHCRLKRGSIVQISDFTKKHVMLAMYIVKYNRFYNNIR